MTQQTAGLTAPRKGRLRTWAVGVGAALVVAWISLVSYVGWAMRQPPEVFGRVMMHMPMPAFFVLPFETLWSRARAGHLNAGDMAPAMTVRRLDDKSPVDLGSLWNEQPVVLVFGSYT